MNRLTVFFIFYFEGLIFLYLCWQYIKSYYFHVSLVSHPYQRSFIEKDLKVDFGIFSNNRNKNKNLGNDGDEEIYKGKETITANILSSVLWFIILFLLVKSIITALP